LEADTAILQLTKMPISCTDCDITQLRRMSVYQLRMAIEQYAPALNTMTFAAVENVNVVTAFKDWLTKVQDSVLQDDIRIALEGK